MIDDINMINYFSELFADFLQNYSADDSLLLFIQLHLVLQGISYKCVNNKIDISSLSVNILNKIRNYIEPGKCYHNAEVACRFIDGAKYVFGYWCLDKPIEHAWIRQGNRYFDPTYQVVYNKAEVKPKAYYPVAELSLPELSKLKKHVPHKEQPDLRTYFSLLGIKYAKIQS